MPFFGIGKKQQRQLACKDAGMVDCNAVFTGKSDAEVLTQAGLHAEKVHSLKASPELNAKLTKLIKNA